VLKVEQVLRVPRQQCHPGVEVRALEVEHSLKTLLPYGVHLILNQKKRDRQCCSSGEVVLAQGGESDMRHKLNVSVGLAADDGPRPQLHGVGGYHYADLTLVHVVGRVPKMDECVVLHSQEPQAMLACGTHGPVLGEVEVGVII
jgi:hypothetical protein